MTSIMDNKQVLEAIKNMKPEAKEMFLLTHRVGLLENKDGGLSLGEVAHELKSTIEDINKLRIDLDRVDSTSAGLIFDLKEKVKEMESENYKTGEAIKELYQDQEDKPKRSWLDRFLGR